MKRINVKPTETNTQSNGPIRKHYAHTNDLTSVHLSVSEFASVGLTLIRFTLTKGAGVADNYVLPQLVLIMLINKTSPFSRLCCDLLYICACIHIYIYTNNFCYEIWLSDTIAWMLIIMSLDGIPLPRLTGSHGHLYQCANEL